MMFDVFGRRVVVEHGPTGWTAFYPSTDGKRRPAHDLRIPSDITEGDLTIYLADLCHEWATPEHQDVRRVS